MNEETEKKYKGGGTTDVSRTHETFLEGVTQPGILFYGYDILKADINNAHGATIITRKEKEITEWEK